jgi:outer membrane protein OmpA-like peptidoglycan-associated protein
MQYILTQKVKLLAAYLAFATIFANSAFAYYGNLNIYGQLGVHKTQSAQTLGHGGFGIGLFLEGAGLENLVENEKFACYDMRSPHAPCGDITIGGDIAIKKYLGVNAYPFLSLGLSEFFDFSIGIPLYAEQLTVENYPKTDDLTAGGQGDMFISAKLRAPFHESVPISLALLAAISIPTGRTDVGKIQNYGPWIRDPLLLSLDSVNYSFIDGNENDISNYSNNSSSLKIGGAATLDFHKMRSAIPFMIHINGAYRTVLGDAANNYPKAISLSVAAEFTPVEYVSIYGEFFNDMPLDWPSKNDTTSKTDLRTVMGGVSFHLGSTVDLQLGVQVFIGDEGKYINNLSINLSDDDKGSYNARLVPKYLAFGGFTVKLFKQKVEVEEEEEEYRNPDTDEDGVCDPWVAESGRRKEFRKVCTGIDLCPYEEGDEENDGCPDKEGATRNPDTDGDGICDPWVAEEDRSDEFEDTCAGIDLCPYEKGSEDDKGCPVKESKSEAPTVIFSVSPETVKAGGTATLTWMTTGATEVSIEGIGAVPAKGTRKVKPKETTTYTLTATGEGGSQTESVEVAIEATAAPSVIFNTSAESVEKGQTATLTWMTTGATEVSIEGIGTVPLKGTRKVKPTETTTYTIVAKGEGGTQIESVEIAVAAPAPVIEAKVNLRGVTFLSGKSELTLNAKQVLDGVAEQLLAAPNVKIEIHGHTDNVGKRASNQELSERRAKAVVGYLATKGIKSSRMKAVGFGQDSPVADNATAAGREQNRRIEMIRVDD